ncbi:MAG: hypothetical protein ACXAEE_10490, partial [Candidatus Thorarchaeota archaeon]
SALYHLGTLLLFLNPTLIHVPVCSRHDVTILCCNSFALFVVQPLWATSLADVSAETKEMVWLFSHWFPFAIRF